MHLFKGFCISCAIYSKLPVPQFEWKEEDMRYHLCFFPFIGIIIGAIELLWFFLCTKAELNTVCRVLIAAAIPILITGGFHIDGFMDTMDALHSFQDSKKKLEILRDPHIGAFSVIMLLCYTLIYVGALAELVNWNQIFIFGIGFALSRSLSGMAVVSFPMAKKDGMVAYFSDYAQKKRVFMILLFQSIIFAIAMIFVEPRSGCTSILFVLLFYLYYYQKSKKEFGGISGDTAGCFVTICEVVILVSLIATQIIYANF